jgi:hypothetical protein
VEKWEEFKFVCFSQNIDQEVIESCRQFVASDYHIENNWYKDTHIVSADLGYSECSDIHTVEQGLNQIKETILMSTNYYDILGRSKEKILLKKLKKNPHKGLKRIVLKTYWLYR